MPIADLSRKVKQDFRLYQSGPSIRGKNSGLAGGSRYLRGRGRFQLNF